MTYPNSLPAYWKVLLDERVRGYVMVAGCALIAIFVIQLSTGSLVAGGVPMLIGILAMVLRWTAMPGFFVGTVAYLAVNPFGAPLPGGRSSVLPSSFSPFDMLLVAAVLVYLHAQFRVYSLAKQAFPDERVKAARSFRDPHDRRPPRLISDNELLMMILFAVGTTIAGQFVWLFITQFEVDSKLFPPIRFRLFVRDRSDLFSMAVSRFLLFTLSFGCVVGLARIVFWYWQIRQWHREEAKLLLLDTGWLESRREYSRIETWRAARIVDQRNPGERWRRFKKTGKRLFNVLFFGFVGICVLLLFLAYFIIR